MNPTLFPIAIGTPELPRHLKLEAQTYEVFRFREIYCLSFDPARFNRISALFLFSFAS